MAIRAFVTTWSVDDLPNGQRQIHNPIVDYIDANVTEPITCSMHYPDADNAGLPNRNRVLILVRSTVIPVATLDSLGNLTGVKLIPPYRFNKPISEIPDNVVQGIKDAIVAEGIPLSALAGMTIYGDFYRKIAKYFNVSHSGFGNYEALSSEFE